MSDPTVKLSLIDKATTQNVVAALVVIAIAGAGVYQLYKEGKTDLLMLVAGSALGYLFGKKV